MKVFLKQYFLVRPVKVLKFEIQVITIWQKKKKLTKYLTRSQTTEQTDEQKFLDFS